MATQNAIERFLSSIFGGGDEQQDAVLRPKARPEKRDTGLMSKSLRPKARPEPEQPAMDTTNSFVSALNDFTDDDADSTSVLASSAARNAYLNGSSLLDLRNANDNPAEDGFLKIPTGKHVPYVPINALETIINKSLADEDSLEDIAFDARLALGRKPEVIQPTVEYDSKKQLEPRSIQQNLVDRGYDIAVDGIIGTQTKKAIKDFQKKSGLKDDGIVGPNTARALGFDSSASEITTETLSPADIPEQIGLMERLSTSTKTPFMAAMAAEALPIRITKDDMNTKEGVKKIQEALNILGYNVGTADGISGNKTKAAIIQFQKDNQLSPDAVIGNSTAAALNEANKSLISSEAETASIIDSMPLSENVKGSLKTIDMYVKAILSPVGKNFINDMLYGGKLSKANPFKYGPLRYSRGQRTVGSEVFSKEALDLMKELVLDARNEDGTSIIEKGSVAVQKKVYGSGGLSVNQSEGGASVGEIVESLATGSEPINEIKLMLGQFNAKIDKNNDIIVTDRFNYNEIVNPLDGKKYTSEQYDQAVKDNKFTDTDVLAQLVRNVRKGEINYKTIRALAFVLGSREGKDQGRRFKINLGPAS
tara:strand:- start:27 stop:1805 length:1779 start_codon:yes stop_codon:yes gene_type:complete